MVSVRNILAAVVAIAIPAIVQATPAQIVQKLKQMTEKTQTLQGPATSLDLVNGPLIAVGEGPFPVGAFLSLDTPSNPTDCDLDNSPGLRHHRRNCPRRRISAEWNDSCSGRYSI